MRISTAEIIEEAHAFIDRLADVWPTIVFYLVVFWIVQLGFGADQLLIVSPFTSLFEVRRQKYNSLWQYVRFVGASALAVVAARIAVQNPVSLVLVNLTVPFIFVFMRSSQLNPRRYFPYTMLFAFLQLRSEQLITMLPTKIAVVAICCAALILGLLLIGMAHDHRHEAEKQLHEHIVRLARALRRASEHGIDDDLRRELLTLRSDFSVHARSTREDSTAPARVMDLLDMFATLAQRTAYLTGSFDWSDHHALDHAHRLGELSWLTTLLADAISGDKKLLQQVADAAVNQLRDVPPSEDRFRIFRQSYLNMVSLVARQELGEGRAPWRMTTLDRLRVEVFRKHPDLESFELRFSLRCGVVLAVTGLVNLLVPVARLYWFNLHAFVLLQPFREESTRRMRTRMLGTVLGCLFVHALAIPGFSNAGVMLVGMVLIACMYASTPGGTASAFFATAYAVAMVSMVSDGLYASIMRIACLGMAIVLVALVDRLVVPTSDQRLFAGNVRQMLAMVGRYWEIVRRSLNHPVDTVVSSETLLHFQTIHAQAVAFVRELGAEEAKNQGIAELAHYQDAAERILFCLWEMMCELEQLELLVRLREVNPEERPAFVRFIDLVQSHCEAHTMGTNAPEAEALAFRLAEPDLRYVLGQYVDRAGELRIAIDEAWDALVERPTWMREVRTNYKV